MHGPEYNASCINFNSPCHAADQGRGHTTVARDKGRPGHGTPAQLCRRPGPDEACSKLGTELKLAMENAKCQAAARTDLNTVLSVRLFNSSRSNSSISCLVRSLFYMSPDRAPSHRLYMNRPRHSYGDRWIQASRRPLVSRRLAARRVHCHVQAACFFTVLSAGLVDG
jgi:hypothetical protein